MQLRKTFWLKFLCAGTFIFLAIEATVGLAEESKSSQTGIELEAGDRIVVLGGTLAERMQHDAWLETLIQSRSLGKKISVRNLGFSADSLNERLRVVGYGSQNDWLKETKPDWIFAFFGFNESFAGEAKVAQFKQSLREFVNNLKENTYNDKNSPQIVLFSPIAHEDLQLPNLPDGIENNRRLKIYSKAIEDVATETDVHFVDLFTPTLAAYDDDSTPWTINGIHLTEYGNQKLGQIIVDALLPVNSKDNRRVTSKLYVLSFRIKTFTGFTGINPQTDTTYMATGPI